MRAGNGQSRVGKMCSQCPDLVLGIIVDMMNGPPLYLFYFLSDITPVVNIGLSLL